MQESRELKIASTIFFVSLALSIISSTLLVWQQSRGAAALSVLLLLAVFLPCRRSSIERISENLLTIQSMFEQQGVPVVFISAPTSHYRLGVPDIPST
jgi:hypothetical protein